MIASAIILSTMRPPILASTYSTTAPTSARRPQVNGSTPLRHPTIAMMKKAATAMLNEIRRTAVLVGAPGGENTARQPLRPSIGSFVFGYRVLPTISLGWPCNEIVPTDSTLAPMAISS